MKSNSIFKIFSLAAALFIAGTLFSNAEQATPTSSKDSTKVEISLPVEKEEFLLFYGLTKDETTNIKITALRKDFINKFEDLKNEYQKSFETVVGDKELIPSIVSENSKEIKSAVTTVTKNVKSDSKSIKNTVTSVSNSVKQYVFTEDNKENIVAPIVNIINEKASVRTESSTWFQKIKAFFGW